MGTKLAHTLALLFSLIVISHSANSENTFTLSGQAYTTTYSKGQWNGEHTFPNIYCAAFPMPDKAIHLRKAFFNNKAVFLVDVLYPEKLAATIAVSTIPDNQSPEEAIANILENERNNEIAMAKAGIRYKVSEFLTDFGRTISIVTTNPSIGNKNGPFPLSRSNFISPNPALPVGGISVHRLFVRGHDRFEVAIIQDAPQLSPISVGDEMTTRLSAMADDMVQSLQQCTSSIPIRGSNSASVTSGEWRDLHGQTHPNIGSVKGIGQLSAQLFFRKNLDETMQNWAQIGKAVYIPSEVSVKRGQSIYSMIAFNGCAIAADKRCNFVVKFKLLTPAGKIEGETSELELWHQQALNVGYVMMPGISYWQSIIDPDDAFGNWTVEAVVTDKNSGTSLTLTNHFRVVE